MDCAIDCAAGDFRGDERMAGQIASSTRHTLRNVTFHSLPAFKSADENVEDFAVCIIT